MDFFQFFFVALRCPSWPFVDHSFFFCFRQVRICHRQGGSKPWNAATGDRHETEGADPAGGRRRGGPLPTWFWPMPGETSGTAKVPSTPPDFEAAVLNGISQLLHNTAASGSEVAEVVHGTTVATKRHPGAARGADGSDYHPGVPGRAGVAPHPPRPRCMTSFSGSLLSWWSAS